MTASDSARDQPPGLGETRPMPPALRQPQALATRPAPPPVAADVDDEIDLAHLLRLALKHKWTLLLALVLGCGGAAMRTLLSTPIYRSTVVLQVDRPTPKVAGLGVESELDRLAGNEAAVMRTHEELLKSRSLAERVVDELRLDKSAAAAGLPAVAARADQAAAPGGTADADAIERAAQTLRKLLQPNVRDAGQLGREEVLRRYLDSITVESARNSRLLKLHVDNPDPVLAARIANATVQAFVAMGMERRLEASTYAKSFLEEQLRQMKARLEASERKLSGYAQANQILTLDEKTNAINQTYTEFASALAKAEQDRIRAEAIAAEMQRGPESSSAVLDNRAIQAYKQRRAELEIEYQQNLRVYKPDYPKMVQIKAQLAEIDAQIRQEIAAIAGAVRAQRDAAAKQEALLRARLQQTRDQVLTVQDRSIDLNLLKREVETNRGLYDNLLQRFKELSVSSNIETTSLMVVDPAQPALFPHKPGLAKNLAIGALLGLMLGAGLVVALELLKDSLAYPDQVEPALGLPLIGVIPRLGRSVRGPVALQVHEKPGSILAEAYRSTRTALDVSSANGPPRRLLVTSAARGEGKSTTALALAINFAQMGRRVLLIDADLRKPTIHTLLGLSNRLGLSNLLSGDSRGTRLIQATQVPNLSVLTAGPVAPNPVELLSGPKLQMLLNVAASLGVEHVIVDAPPMLGLADAVVLGNQLHNVLFVVQAGKTRTSLIRNALGRLAQSGLVPRGVVLTQTPESALPQGYASYYGYGYGQPAQGPGLGSLAGAR